ncbi:transposase [Melissococcus plutonius]|uniref:transposase n=1 Tax=Melissococcus plutonius TaxID=33970 RepID=UPI00024F226E|nr:hypothetical protein MPD5_1649 [Melissococcus plutonius DAT561]
MNISISTISRLKVLYHLRSEVETSFRELNYALDLAQFHSKKFNFILQGIYVRLIMYNFLMEIALAVKWHYLSI